MTDGVVRGYISSDPASAVPSRQHKPGQQTSLKSNEGAEIAAKALASATPEVASVKLGHRKPSRAEGRVTFAGTAVSPVIPDTHPPALFLMRAAIAIDEFLFPDVLKLHTSKGTPYMRHPDPAHSADIKQFQEARRRSEHANMPCMPRTSGHLFSKVPTLCTVCRVSSRYAWQ